MAGSIESVYGKALFDAGMSSGVFDELSEEAAFLARIFKTEETLLPWFSDRNIPMEEKVSVLGKVMEENALSLSVIMKNFFFVLSEKRREGRISGILNTFLFLADEEKKIGRVVILSARPLSDSEKEKIEARLTETIPGKKLIFSYQVDETVLGGIRITYNGHVADGTVKTKLTNLKRELKNLQLK